MEDMEQQLELWKQQQDQRHKAAQQQQQQRARAVGSIFSSPRPGGVGGSTTPGSGCKPGGLKARSTSTSPWYGPKVVPGSTATAGGAGKSPAPSPAAAAMSGQVELLYKVLHAQQDTEVNLRARITGLRQQMEQLGIIKTDAEHQASKTLGRWGDNLDSDGLDDEYGSEGSSDSGYEREPESRTAAPRVSGGARFGAAAAAAAAGTPSVALGTPSRGAAAAPGRGATPAGSSALSGMSAFATPAVSGKGGSGSAGLHWVSPGATAAKTSSRFTPGGSGGGSGSAGARRQVTPGSTSAGSSQAWRKLATELSNSTGQKASGSGRSKVRTTYATPTSSRSSGQRSLVPDRPSSPLQIPAAAAATAAAPAAGGAAAPSEPFSFSKAGESGAVSSGLSTPAATKAAVPSKLSFSPAATPAAAAAAGGAASPALSPLWNTPAGAGSKAGEGSVQFSLQANPLFGMSPGAASTPLAPVPAPALDMGAAPPKAAAAAGRPPAKRADPGGQPPEPPAGLQQAAQSRVSWGAVCRCMLGAGSNASAHALTTACTVKQCGATPAFALTTLCVTHCVACVSLCLLPAVLCRPWHTKTLKALPAAVCLQAQQRGRNSSRQQQPRPSLLPNQRSPASRLSRLLSCS
jgi:hypothetical protein